MSTPHSGGARKRLPAQPSQENLRKQAKHRAKLESIQLAQAQHRLATEYGCRNWAELMQLVEAMNRGAEVPLMSSAGVPNKPLQSAARAKDMDAVRRLLDAGQYTQEELDSGLAGALWYGDEATQWPQMKAIADLLLEYGADVNGSFTNYGRIVFGTGECRMPVSLQYLIDNGADVAFTPVDTKYGKQCPLGAWLGTYTRGHNDRKHRGVEILLKHGAFIPPEVTPPILAIHRGDVKTLSAMIDEDPSLPRRHFPTMPYGNMSLRGATLLHCAVEFGELECFDLLLDRWMEPNIQAAVIDGIGGQTPIYHAIGGNNLPALEHFVKRLGYAIEGHRIRATFRVGKTVYGTPMTPIEYAEKLHGEGRASDREVELVRSTVWPGIKRKSEAERTPIEQLQAACRLGGFDAVKRLVESGEVPKEKLNLGIEGCAMTKREDIARYLIDHGADINADYIDNYGPVLLGFCEGLHDEEVEFVLKLGARPDWERRPSSKYPHHSTPLLMTCQTYVRGRNAAKHRILDLLIAAGARPEDEVLMAVHRGDVKRLAELIDADPTIVRKDRQWTAMFNFADEPRLARGTLLHVAIDQNEIGCADLILSRYRSWNDSDINTKAEMMDGFGGHTPLFLAANSWMGVGYPTVQWIIDRVGQFIDTGVVGTMRKDGKPVQQTVMEYAGARERKLLEPFDRITQIRRAIAANDLATFTRMLDEHPDLATPRLWGDVIHKAKSVEMTRILLDRGVNPNEGPPRKPLHLAAYYSLADIIELLIEHGADATFLNPLNERPIDLIDAYEPRPIGDEQSRRSREALIKAGATHDIHTAVRTGDVELVRRMLDADPSLVHTPQPWNPLFTAARAGRLEVAKLLLERGAKVDGTNDKGNTPLWFACQSPAKAEDRIAVAKLLIDAGADVNKRCEDGSTPLHFAAWRGPVEMVRLLLDHGARHWIANDKGKTPADDARSMGAAADKEAILEVLSGFRVDDVPFRDAIAAIDAGDVPRLKQLLAEHPRLVTDRLKSDSTLTRGYFANPALLWFVAENPIRNHRLPPNIVEVAEAIIDAGAKLDDIKYTTALVASGLVPREMKVQVPLIEMLVRRGADPNDALESAIGEREQEAAAAALRLGAKHTLVSAAAMGELDTLRRLLKDNPSEKEKLRALQFAAQYGRMGAVDTLLDAGVDINARLPRVYEPTALHEAANFGHRRLVDRMLQRGADPTIKDTQFDGTAAGWAWHGGHQELSEHIRSVAPLIPAITAVRRGDVDTLKQLLADKPELAHARLNGRTLIHMLADWPANLPRAVQSLRAIVAAGGDVNASLHQDTDAANWDHNAKALHWSASAHDATDLTAALIELGAEVDPATSDDGTTPLTNAVHFGITGAQQVLLNAGAKVSLILAAGMGDLERARSFFNPDGSLKSGAGTPPFREDADARKILAQAINFATFRGHPEMVRFLASHGAPLSDPDSFVKHNATPLHRAALREDIPMMKLLLELGADPEAKDPTFNDTALGWAKHNNRPKSVEFLSSPKK